jgi:hypothetical protein
MTQMITNKEILIEVNLARPVKTLRALASAAGIVGRSKMNKAELVEAIAAFEVAQERGAAVPAEKCLLEHGYVKPCQQDRGHAGECDKETVGLVRETGTVAGRIPTNLCDHGIDLRRTCSICLEDEQAAEIDSAVEQVRGLAVSPTPAPQRSEIEEGTTLVDPRSLSGQQYRFVNWTRFGAKLINVGSGGVRIVRREDLAAWERVPAGGPAEPATMMCAKSFVTEDGRGICAVRQAPGARGNHEGPHYDDQRRLWSEDYVLPGDRRPRCGIEMPALPGMAEFTGPTRVCGLTLNADMECPDVNHKPVSPLVDFAPTPSAVRAAQIAGRVLRDAPPVGPDSDYARELAEALIAVQKQRHELRCALAHPVGCWGVNAADKPYAAALDDVLKSHR